MSSCPTRPPRPTYLKNPRYVGSPTTLRPPHSWLAAPRPGCPLRLVPPWHNRPNVVFLVSGWFQTTYPPLASVKGISGIGFLPYKLKIRVPYPLVHFPSKVICPIFRLCNGMYKPGVAIYNYDALPTNVTILRIFRYASWDMFHYGQWWVQQMGSNEESCTYHQRCYILGEKRPGFVTCLGVY